MSVLTEVLKLFKYDPATDGDMTFNLTQCLNNNWDKLDAAILLAIAAAGAYNPEESYAVGDYCTYKGKLRKCSTAIPTGEAWTEAHWTTTTVAAELAELSSQLSNLAGEKYTKMLADIPQTWDEIWELGPGVYSWVQSIPLEWQPEDTPSGALRVELSVHTSTPDVPGGTRSAMLSYIDGAATRARYIGERTSSGDYWAKLATATPPQEFDLPLADGISNYATSVYHKNQFNEVSVRVSISATNAIQNGATIATLPEGFRPAKAIDTDATGYVSGSSWFACRLVIQPSGAVQVYCGIGSSTATFIVGSFEPYLAAN